MGIYDRDYYRREGPSFLNRYSVRGQVVAWILGVTVVLFFLQVLTRQRLHFGGFVSGPVTDWLELVPSKVLSGEVWRLLTYAFVHDDGTHGSDNFFMHILINMWMFYLFAGYVEDDYGRWEFLCFYLASALAGGLVYTALAFANLQGGPDSSCVGASGAVTATMVLCAWRHPNLTILFMFVLPMPVWALAAIHVAQDALGLLRGGGQVAFSVHLAGAALASIYFTTNFRFLGWMPSFRTWRLARSRPKFRVYRGDEETPQPVPVGFPDEAELDEQLEAKVDAVLEKIGRSGRESLTDAERQLLLKAGEIYKRRRS